MRLIDADEALNVTTKYIASVFPDTYEFARQDAELLMETIPTIELVRCKECRWYKPYLKQFEYTPRGDGSCRKARMTADGLLEINTSDDDFCSYGEKQTERREP